ncbi:MAG: dienelactone hydrolase family protein [Clostridia bacterium]|nr:dienelactone hydrolase family protein [Clostridia bacterium]
MNKLNVKIIAIITAICCLLISLPVYAISDGTDIPEITISSSSAYPGDEVSVNISISNNPGIAYLKLNVGYDSTLTLKSAENKSVLSGTFTTSEATTVKPYVLQWMNASNSSKNGIVATISFEISNQAPAGAKNLTISVVECYNASLEDIIFTSSNGTVTVFERVCAHTNTTLTGAKTATCCENGYTGDTYCADCGVKIADGTVIPATNNHVDADGKWERDEIQHWHTCYYGMQFDISEHCYDDDQDETCNDCGYVRTIDIPSSFTAKSISTDNLSNFQYWLYTPVNPTDDMPLLVYLHGGSGKGDDLNLITAVDGFPKYLQDGDLGNIPAYIIIPQLPSSKKGWTDVGADLMSLIRSVRNTYGISADRVSLTGHSMGGTGTWGIAAAYPATFSRIAPCSGSINNTTINVNKIKNIPVRAFVGSADTIVSPDSSISFVDSLKAVGGDADITVFDGAGHFDVPALVYLNSNIDIINWLISVPCFHTNITSIPEKLSTCSEQGWYEYSQCNDCGQLFDESGNKIYEIPYRPLLSHTATEPVRENEVAATCSVAGSYDEVVYCSVCHEEVSREKKTIPIDEDAHDWGEWVQTKAPTETEPGEETRTCKNDPNHTETREIPALGPSQVELSFLDDEVIIVVPNGAAPDGSEFDVQKIVPPPEEVVEKVKDQMGTSSEVLAYYEIRLFETDGTLIIHLDGEITIKTKMPEQYVRSKCVRILQEDETGKLIIMESWWEGEYLCYKTDWLEIYN